jgi:4-oxalmesaconate hydratase
MTRTIYVHGHVSAPPPLYAFQANLRSRGTYPYGPALQLKDADLKASTDHHIELLDGAGIDLQIISARPYTMMHSARPTSIVREWIQSTNDVVARAVDFYPKRLQGMAALPQYPGKPLDDAIAELRRCVGDLGFLGCVLNPDPGEGTVHDQPNLADEYWYPLYDALAELGVPALVHGAGCRLEREHFSMHFITEESIAAYALMESTDVWERWPNLKIIVSHGGGSIPFQAGRFRALRARSEAFEPFDVSMRRLWYDTCLYSREGLELLFKAVGTDRCLFGTEKPGTGSSLDKTTGRAYDDILPLVEELTGDDFEMVVRGNAEKVFRLPGSDG